MTVNVRPGYLEGFTFLTQDVFIRLDGHKDADGSEIEVEVEYELDGYGEFSSITKIAPFVRALDGTTFRYSEIKTYLDCPKWLETELKACVDVDTLAK